MRHCVSPEVNRAIDALCKQMDTDDISRIRISRYSTHYLGDDEEKKQKVEFVVHVEVTRSKEEVSDG